MEKKTAKLKPNLVNLRETWLCQDIYDVKT